MIESTSLSREATGPAPRLSARVLPADGAGLQAYAAFCAGALHAPPQDPHWARAWLAGRDGLIVLLEAEKPILALALEISRNGSFRVARFAGGRHANGNFPALHPARLPAGEVASLLAQAIRGARPDIDMLALERQRESFEGAPNPLLAMPHVTSVNPSLAVDLTGGFEKVLERSSGTKRARKHRWRSRRLEDAGGCRRIEARTPEEVDAMLDTFFALKQERFAKKGIPDAFADSQVQANFRALFRSALAERTPPFVLHGLEVGGKLRAITGSSRTGQGLICEFSTFAEDELSPLSPGDFLFYEEIAAACAEGLSIYDFSVGDEPYKRQWCDIESRHADVFLGLSVRGRLLAGAHHGLVRLKRKVKQNPALLRLAQRLRGAALPRAAR